MDQAENHFKNLVFFQSNSQEQWPSPQHTIFSFTAAFQGCSTQSESHRKTCCAFITAGHDCGHELWRCSCRASCSDDNSASHHRLWPLTDVAKTRPPEILMTLLLESLCLTCWNKTVVVSEHDRWAVQTFPATPAPISLNHQSQLCANKVQLLHFKLLPHILQDLLA